MQLQYAYILNSLIPLMRFRENDNFRILLEHSVRLDHSSREIDLLLEGTDGDKIYTIAVEMKCYREYAFSGGKRGATDIFMKDVYADLELLEKYVDRPICDEGVELVMNNLERLIFPKRKDAKCWAYDISDGTSVRDITITTPIGGKEILIELKKEYKFTWINNGEF